jgi:hypothetical protein
VQDLPPSFQWFGAPQAVSEGITILATEMPLYPAGFADPERTPLYPQEDAEIMAGRRALSAQEAQMPASLGGVVVGPDTAREIRWTHH